MKRFDFFAGFLALVSLVSCQSAPLVEAQVPISEDALLEASMVSAEEPLVRVQPETVADGGLVRLEVIYPARSLQRVSSPAALEVEGVGGAAAKADFKFFRSSKLLRGATRFEAFFAVPNGQKPGPLEIPIRSSDGRKFKAVVTVVSGGYASETLSVDPRHVKPPPEALARMQKESSEIGRVYRSSVPEMLWSGKFELPLQSAITSNFGTRRVYNGAMQSFHSGTDFKAPVGTAVLAPAGGRVVLCKDLYMTGKTVILDHGHGLFTVYAHLSEFGVRKGNAVRKGESLGLSGATGRTSGPHLHWAAVVHRTKFNPMDLLKLVR